MSHARIEEVSDSDPEIDDPTDYLPPNDDLIIQPKVQPASTSSSSQPRQQQQNANPTLFRPPPGGGSGPGGAGFGPPPQMRSQADVERYRTSIKDYCMLYPCYFSSTRTRSQGRRVSKALATPNPLAYNLIIALKEVIDPDTNQIHIAFEPDKTHPKDWANPGRVRVQLFDKDTHAPLHPTIKNKEHLYVEVAKYLQQNPTKKQDPLEMKIAGLPIPEKFLDTKISVPRGWGSMNTILPVHSAAVSGGGVKDDFFKEALEEMKQVQGASGGGDAGGMAGLQSMMQSMGGLGGMGGMGGMGLPGMGGGGGGSSGDGGKKKKNKKG